MRRWTCAVVGMSALCGWLGCADDQAADSGPLLPSVVVDPPTDTCSCQPGPSIPNAFSDIQETRITITRVPERDATRSSEELQPQLVYARTTSVGEELARLPEVPAGGRYTLELFANGAERSWYGRTTGLTVPTNDAAAAQLMITPFGGFSLIQHPGLMNPVLSAAVDLGDGRVFVSGGFAAQAASDGAPLLGPARAGWFIFDSALGSIVADGLMPTARGAHAMAFLPATNQVLVIGGASSLPLAPDEPFPFAWPDSAGVIGCELFDLPSEEQPGGRWRTGAGLQLRLPRVFPRVAALADGTVAVTGGGPWPGGGEAGYRRLELFYPASSGLRTACQDDAESEPPCFVEIHAFDS